MKASMKVSAREDPVTRFLHERGRPTRPAYLGTSYLQIGRVLEDRGLRVVYRFEDDGVLLLCSIESIERAADDASRDEGMVRTLLVTLKQIEGHVAEVREIHGLVIEDVLSETLREERKRLRQIYESYGAKPRVIDGRTWMVYTARQAVTQNRTRLN